MTILLVEDNPNIALGLQYSFQQKGYQFAVCPSLQASREYLAAQRPQLVILDVMLPDGSGFDFAEDYASVLPQELVTEIEKNWHQIRI